MADFSRLPTFFAALPLGAFPIRSDPRNNFGKERDSLRDYGFSVMAERSPIEALGRIVEVHEPGHLYQVEMANGYRAYAIVERKGPALPEGADARSCIAVVHFSPFDMSKCRIVGWQVPS